MWFAIAVGLVWGLLNILGNLDEAQVIIANQSPTVKMLITLAASPPWWVPIGVLVACVIVLISLEFDLLPHTRAELNPFSTKIVRAGDQYRLRVGVKNTSNVKAIDAQITTLFWRCSGTHKPFTVRKSSANPISQDVPEQVELDFTIEPTEPVFIVMSFAYRSRPRGKLREQRPSFYYKWNGTDSSLPHASREERDVIIQRLKKRETIPPAIEFHGHVPGSNQPTSASFATLPKQSSRTVTDDQAGKIIDRFKGVKIRPLMISTRQGVLKDDPEAHEYALQIKRVLRQAGVTINEASIGLGTLFPTGVSLFVKSRLNNDEMAAAIMDAIKFTGVQCKTRDRQVWFGTGAEPEINLIIGANELTLPS